METKEAFEGSGQILQPEKYPPPLTGKVQSFSPFGNHEETNSYREAAGGGNKVSVWSKQLDKFLNQESAQPLSPPGESWIG